MSDSEKTILMETYDKDKAIEILNGSILHDICNDEKKINKCKNMLSDIIENNGKIEVTYNSKIEGGRMYANKGLQMVKSEVRKYLQENRNLLDIDIKNSICSVVNELCKKHNIKHDVLNNYVINREEIINKYYEGNKKKCKEFIQFCFFNDETQATNDFERNMCEEVKKIIVLLSKVPKYKKTFEYAKKRAKEKETNNKYGSFIFHIYEIHENEILTLAKEYYELKTGLQPFLLQFDGFQAYEHENFTIKRLNKYIKKHSEIVVEFALKDINCTLNMKENIPFMTLNDLDTPSNLCEKIRYDLNKVLVYCNEHWHMKKDNLWSIVREPSYVIISIINNYIKSSKRYISKKILDVKEKEKIDNYSKIMNGYDRMKKKIDSSSYYSMITKHLKTLLLDNDFINRLDSNKYYVCFNNGTYNIKNNKFFDNFDNCPYITQRINYNYDKATKKDTKEVYEILKKICNNNEEHMNYYLSVLGYALTGDAGKEQSIYFCIGNKGANGKSVILNALKKYIIPCYADTINRNTFEVGYDKKHKHLVKFRTNRILYIEELSKTKELEIETLKEIADGNSFDNEVLYGVSENINMMSKLFCLGNHTINIEEDGGTTRRVKILEFLSHFSPDAKEDNVEKKIFIQDKQLGEKLGGKYKHALLNILLKYAHEYYVEGKLKPEPKEFIEAKQETMDANNTFKCWFEDNCELGDDYKTGKEELMKASKLSFKELKDKLKRMDLTYNKDKMLNHKRGLWEGFRIKKENDEASGNEDN